MSKQNFWKWLLLTNVATSFYCVGAAWLAELNWMLWRYVSQPDFTAYHFGWWHGIWWAIFPVAGLAFLGICFQLKWRPPFVHARILWAALILQIVLYTGTVLWWGPGNGLLKLIRLPNGQLNPLYLQLAASNWIRVLLVTMSGFLEVWIAIKCFIKNA